MTDIQALYTFDEGNEEESPNPAIMDQSPAGNHGTSYGALFQAEEDGYVLALDGRSAFAKCAHKKKLLFGTEDFSVDFWIQLNSLKAGIVMGKKGADIDDAGWAIEVSERGDALRVIIADGSQHEIVEAALPEPEKWHHIAVVRRGNTVSLFIDGKEGETKTNEALGVSVNNEEVFLHLGKMLGKTRSMHGHLDDVAVWPRALEPGEVEARYQSARLRKEKAQTSRSGTATEFLVLHYRFDSDSGDIARDLSGNGNDGKIIDGEFLPPENGNPSALRFNGESAYVDIPAAPGLRLQGDMSFEMWVRQHSTQKTRGAVLFGEASPGTGYLFSLEFDYNLLFFYRSQSIHGNDRIALPVTRKMLASDWQHITVVVEYPRCRFYLNGELIRDQYMPFPGVESLPKRALRLGGEPVNDYFSPVDLREFRLYRRALAAEEVLARSKGEELTPATFTELAVEPDWYKSILTIRCVAKGTTGLSENIVFEIDKGEQTAIQQTASWKVAGLNRMVAETQISLDGLNGKSIKVKAVGLSDEEKTVSLQKPAWIQGVAGRNDEVPKPWTPIQVESSDNRVEVSVWGRQYVFDGLLLPSAISAAGEELLASPVTLPTEIDGNKVDWKASAIKVIKASDRAVELEQTLQSGAVALTIFATIEYDGFLHYRMAIRTEEPVTLNHFVIDVPLNSNHARFCYADRAYSLADGNHVATFHSDAIRSDLGFQFSPNVWIGDDERGLTWQAESDQYWSPSDPQKYLEILPGKNATQFLANIIRQDEKLNPGEERKYEFALLATPVKPLLRDAWELRVARYEPWGTDFQSPYKTVNGKPELEVLADLGVRNLFSFVTDAYSWPMPLHEEFAKGLTGFVQGAHKAGLNVHPYVIHQRIAVEVPEFDLYGSHMGNRPMKSYSHPFTYPRNPKRPGSVAIDYGADSSSTAFMCAKSEALRDAFVGSLDDRLKKFGENGVYLDGTVHIGPLCSNEEHGCGYRDSEGKLKGTYPTFSIREMMRRIYTTVKTHRPDGIVDVHCSYGFNPSGLAYADIMWTGEQWHHLRKTGTEYVAEELTTDKFRTEFTGRQLGVAAETLHYRLRNPMKIAATSLLHDISPRYSTGAFDNARQAKDSYFALVPQLWKMRDAFGAREAKKLWYWNNQDYVQIPQDQCHSTLLKHPANGTLAVISNLSRDTQTVVTSFNLEKLGLAGKEIEAVNPLTDELLAITADGQFTTTLGSEEWLYVWLRPKNHSMQR